jgi:hypothetical protein
LREVLIVAFTQIDRLLQIEVVAHNNLADIPLNAPINNVPRRLVQKVLHFDDCGDPTKKLASYYSGDSPSHWPSLHRLLATGCSRERPTHKPVNETRPESLQLLAKLHAKNVCESSSRVV